MVLEMVFTVRYLGLILSKRYSLIIMKHVYFSRKMSVCGKLNMKHTL